MELTDPGDKHYGRDGLRSAHSTNDFRWPPSPTNDTSIRPLMGAGKKKRRSFGRPVAEAARQAWRDLRLARWANFGLWALYWSSLAAIFTAILMLSTPLYSAYMFRDTLCRPDGSIGGEYNFWDFSGFFDISLAAGSFTFTNVKMIDIAWQLV